MRKLMYILILLTFGNIYAQSNIKVNGKAPKINITNWIENIPNDKNLNDKYIVLEFWATWCGPCIAAVPHMNKIQEEFNQKDLYYISITDESIAKVERSLKRIEFKSIVVTDLTKETQINFGDGIKGLDEYPLTVLIDKSGIIKWIGEPKNLNSAIMSKFLSNGNTENIDFDLEKNVSFKEQQQTFDFKELMSNKEVKYYLELQETESTEISKQAMGTSIINLKSYRLEDIYNDILNIKNDQLELPETIKNTRFDLIYKNTKEPKNLNLLEKDILKKLNLKKQTVFKPTKVNVVSIQDQSLLEETLEKRFSSKSDADDKIIFTAYTINNTLVELSNISSVSFKFNDKNETKYDFIIGIKSKNDIISSLKSYGLIVEEKDVKIEYIKLISEK
ncbi:MULTISPECIES: TlpA family protein disulfide reductase [Winogradskyella]|uniref:TlpA family protein disulfide reductase n=1 Tax=Winogradskyella TaxID=286104 RepID=UPI0015CE6AEF|nr:MULTISPECIES: TlpA disulfide reductase family protein [Winogradskyella]QXP79213.1 TlpA family protein disulfide reductase [Winogradskyella sp. HaHa_3_26]